MSSENGLGPARLYEAFGDKKSLWDWSRDPRCVVKFSVLSGRMQRRWRLDRALTTPAAAQNVKHKAFGEERTIAAWARDPHCTASASTLYNQVDAMGPGETFEDVLTKFWDPEAGNGPERGEDGLTDWERWADEKYEELFGRGDFGG